MVSSCSHIAKEDLHVSCVWGVALKPDEAEVKSPLRFSLSMLKSFSESSSRSFATYAPQPNKVVRETSKEQKKRTYIRSDLELLVHASRVRRCSQIFAEQILVEHGFDFIVGVSVLIATDTLTLAAELAEDFEGGPL